MPGRLTLGKRVEVLDLHELFFFVALQEIVDQRPQLRLKAQRKRMTRGDLDQPDTPIIGVRSLDNIAVLHEIGNDPRYGGRRETQCSRYLFVGSRSAFKQTFDTEVVANAQMIDRGITPEMLGQQAQHFSHEDLQLVY